MSNVDDLQLIVELAERGVSCPKCGAQFEVARDAAVAEIQRRVDRRMAVL